MSQKTPPDKYVDIRVRVPHDADDFAVNCGGKGWNRFVEVLGVYPAGPAGPTEVHDPVYEPPKHENVTDRLNAVEAQNRDIMRQLVNLRKSDAAQAETIAGMAAKIHALANRCDTIERRAKAAAMGIYDAQDAILKIDEQMNGSDYKRTIGLRSRVGAIQDRVSAVEQTTARIEDMLTEPQAAPTVKDETVRQGCQCQLCRWIRGDDL